MQNIICITLLIYSVKDNKIHCLELNKRISEKYGTISTKCYYKINVKGKKKTLGKIEKKVLSICNI